MLADDAYWLFHDDRSGRSRVPSRTTGTALAAAMLAEQSASGLLEVSADAVRHRASPPSSSMPGRRGARLDTVALDVFERVTSEADTYAIRPWLIVLGPDAATIIGTRMTGAGLVYERHVLRSLRRRVVYLPVDPIKAAWPAARLATGVRQMRRFTTEDAFLLGLAAATPLAGDLFRDSTADMRRLALEQVRELPPAWSDLLEAVRVTVAADTLTNRA